MALEAAEKKATTVRAGASRAYREVEATRILVYHVLDLLLSHVLVLRSRSTALCSTERQSGGYQRV